MILIILKAGWGAGWLSSEGLRHVILSGKLLEGHAVEVRSVSSSHVVVNNRECSSMPSFFQVVFKSMRPIEAEDDEVTW